MNRSNFVTNQAAAILGLALLLPTWANRAEEPPSNQANTAIRAVIQSQQDAWNRGDIDAFMNGYARSDKTVFVSGDEVTRGWQTVRDRYKAKYSDSEKMAR
jgi:hypothetical protein